MQSYEVAFLCEMSIFIIIKRSYMFVDCNLLDIVSNQKHVMYNPNMEHHTIFQQVTQSLHLTNTHSLFHIFVYISSSLEVFTR